MGVSILQVPNGTQLVVIPPDPEPEVPYGQGQHRVNHGRPAPYSSAHRQQCRYCRSYECKCRRYQDFPRDGYRRHSSAPRRALLPTPGARTFCDFCSIHGVDVVFTHEHLRRCEHRGCNCRGCKGAVQKRKARYQSDRFQSRQRERRGPKAGRPRTTAPEVATRVQAAVFGNDVPSDRAPVKIPVPRAAPPGCDATSSNARKQDNSASAHSSSSVPPATQPDSVGTSSAPVEPGRPPTSSAPAPRPKRPLQCRLCKNHGSPVEMKGHTDCPYEACDCDKCEHTRDVRKKKASSKQAVGKSKPFCELKLRLFAKEEGAARSRSDYYCGNCRNHGKMVKINGHKKHCEHAKCPCEECKITCAIRRRKNARNLELKKKREGENKANPAKKTALAIKCSIPIVNCDLTQTLSIVKRKSESTAVATDSESESDGLLPSRAKRAAITPRAARPREEREGHQHTQTSGSGGEHKNRQHLPEVASQDNGTSAALHDTIDTDNGADDSASNVSDETDESDDDDDTEESDDNDHNDDDADDNDDDADDNDGDADEDCKEKNLNDQSCEDLSKLFVKDEVFGCILCDEEFSSDIALSSHCMTTHGEGGRGRGRAQADVDRQYSSDISGDAIEGKGDASRCKSKSSGVPSLKCSIQLSKIDLTRVLASVSKQDSETTAATPADTADNQEPAAASDEEANEGEDLQFPATEASFKQRWTGSTSSISIVDEDFEDDSNDSGLEESRHHPCQQLFESDELITGTSTPIKFEPLKAPSEFKSENLESITANGTEASALVIEPPESYEQKYRPCAAPQTSTSTMPVQIKEEVIDDMLTAEEGSEQALLQAPPAWEADENTAHATCPAGAPCQQCSTDTPAMSHPAQEVQYGLEPFACTLCGKRFACLQALGDHHKKHLALGRAGHCELCFAWLSTEMLSQPHRCATSPKEFTREQNLAGHFLSVPPHAPDVVLRCGRCGERSNSPNKMKKHLEKCAYLSPSKVASHDRLLMRDHGVAHHAKRSVERSQLFTLKVEADDVAMK